MSDQMQKPRRRIFNAYVLFWMLGAAFAATYLAVLGTHPELFAKSQTGPDLEQQLAQTQRDVTRAISDIDPLKQSVGQIKTDVDNLKTAQQQASDRDQLLLDKLTTLESSATAGKTMGQAETTPPAAKPEPHKTVAAAAPEAAEGPATVPPIKAQKKTAAAAPKGPAIETGSIASPKTAQAAAAAAKPAQIGLLLGNAPSVDAVKLNWTILNDRHADAVRNLHPRYVAMGKGAERTYALLAGPVSSPEQAKTLCKLMLDRGVACEVSTYRGTAF